MNATTRRIGWTALVVYGISIVLANWLIRNAGPVVLPGGNHLAPVGFGLYAPSGTYAAGVTFVARDVIQRTIGKRWSLVVIPIGALVSALFSPQVALASFAAFLFGELMDFAVYTPLARRDRRFVVAVVASGLCASVVDSVLFLGLAGIPLSAALPGLLLGKAWVMLVAAPVAYGLRLWLRRQTVAPAVKVA